ncbi:MAG: hypothetical protein MUC87_08980 [Bacteroidia bacterium]|jgi:hypothetical protein|nr:hypothetical protein [Bacteroidia bacterium]
MTHKRAVLLDTSFFLRFLNDSDPLFQNADNYYRYFLDNEINMLISTITVAEYCVGGNVNELPLRSLQILPFNFNHSLKAGEFARIAFQARKAGSLLVNERKIIPNDTKLFAQGDCEHSVQFFLSSDVESLSVYNLLKQQVQISFQFIDLRNPHTETFGLLDLK